MPVIRFGEWAPDQADLGNPGVVTATNVFPSASGYKPVGTLTPVSDALDARPRGAIQARDKDLNVRQYAGDASKIYENVSGSWTDRSIAGGYSTAGEENWEFAAWENKMLAVNFSDNPQQITFGGSNFSDLTTALQARHITVIRNHVVLANTNDASDGAVPARVRWSAFNDETDFTVSASTLSDFEDLKTAPVERIFGGEFGVILQTDSVWRMTFVGAPPVFQFDEVLPGIGVIAAGAAVQDGDVVYFLSDKGFFALHQGTQPQRIGANKVDRFVLDDLDNDNKHRISSSVDATSNRVFWAYPGSGNTSGRPNKIIVYDRTLDRWSLIEQDVELLVRAGSVGLTLDQLDTVNSSLDALTPSLDSRAWVGGAAELGAFDSDFKLGFFDGANMTATLETAEMEIHSGRRTHLNAFRPLVEGGSVTAKVGTRNRQTDTESFGSTLTQRSTGRFVCRENARYHRFRLFPAGSWAEAMGVQIEPKEARKAEGRG